MTEAELRAQHPEAFTALDKKHEEATKAAKADGVTEGTNTERKRALDHIKLGKGCGDLETAHKAIESGASVSDMQADYLAASMKRGAVETRQQETDAAGAAVGGKPPAAPTGKTLEDEVAAELNSALGDAPDKGPK